jgi:hypothetical protein
MKWIVFEATKEKSILFISSLPTEYWHKNKNIFFRKEHNCSLLIKEVNNNFKFIISSTHKDFTSFIISKIEIFGFDFKYVDHVEDTKDYEFIISKEIDQLYVTKLNQQIGDSRVELLKEKYFNSHIDKYKGKLLEVFRKISKYEFEFSILIATSYLEELISETFKLSFELDRYNDFEKNVRTSLTLSAKIEFLFAKGIMDKKTYKTLYHIRKIRNLLAHQSVLENKHEQSIDSHIQNIKNICDNGILYTPESIEGITDKRLIALVPVMENLCFAFIGVAHFTTPFIRIGGVHYANKGYGQGFFYSVTPEFVSNRVLDNLQVKYKNLNIKPQEYHKYDIKVRF